MKKRLLEIVDRYRGKTVCIIGDIMLDHFMFGSIEKISPEAPVPVVSVHQESFRPGGAGRTASITASLGGKVILIGVVGDDPFAQQLLHELRIRHIDIGNILVNKRIKTTQKIRVLSRDQHVVRIDRDNEEIVDKGTEAKIIQMVRHYIEGVGCFIVSDYAKGLVTRKLAKSLLNLAQEYKKPIVVDTKPEHISYFQHATLLTPNYKEAKEFTKLEDLEKMGSNIQERLHCNVLITKDSEGMILFHDNSIAYFPAKARTVSHTAGAGDAVVATLALSLASNSSLKEATAIANTVAAIVIEKTPMARITINEVRKRILMEKDEKYK